MKKNNFKKIFVVFSLCVFLFSMFSVSSFALNVSDVHTGYLYEFKSSLVPSGSLSQDGVLTVSGYVVDKISGNMTAFDSLYYKKLTGASDVIWGLGSNPPPSNFNDLDVFNSVVGTYGSIYIDFSDNSISKSEFDSFLSQRWTYTVTSLDTVSSMFDKANIALVGGVNNGVAYDGLLGMISKFGKFLVSSPLLLVLCIALPLVSFSVGLIIRIKNRA